MNIHSKSTGRRLDSSRLNSLRRIKLTLFSIGLLWFVTPGVFAAQIAFMSINAGANPIAGIPFDIAVQLQDDAGVAQNAASNTDVLLAVSTGAGLLNTGPFCSISAGSNSCTGAGVIYSKAEPGVVLTAYTSDNAVAGNSAPFMVDAPVNAKVLVIRGNGFADNTITVNPSGLSCATGGTCITTFPSGTPITLTYTADPFRLALVSWGGDCVGITPSCSFTLNGDAIVSVKIKNSSSHDTISSSFATEAITNVAGNQTQRIDQFQTRILGRYQGTTVFDQTFNLPVADPLVQAAMTDAGNAVRTFANNPSLPINPAQLITSADSLVSSSLRFKDVVTTSLNTTLRDFIGGAETPGGPVNTAVVGYFGNCIQAPDNCGAGPFSLYEVVAATAHLDVLSVTGIQTSRTLVTQETHQLGSTYLIASTEPVVNTVQPSQAIPALSEMGLILLSLGMLIVAIRFSAG